MSNVYKPYSGNGRRLVIHISLIPCDSKTNIWRNVCVLSSITQWCVVGLFFRCGFDQQSRPQCAWWNVQNVCQSSDDEEFVAMDNIYIIGWVNVIQCLMGFIAIAESSVNTMYTRMYTDEQLIRLNNFCFDNSFSF